MLYPNDYLTTSAPYPAQLTEEGSELVLTNGLAERRFILKPDFACVGLKNLYSGEQFLRSIKPEISLTIDGVYYPVGGVTGQTEHGYMNPAWYETFGPSEGFRYRSHRVVPITRDIEWKRCRHATAEVWPPKGVCLEVTFASDRSELSGIEVIVRYECYDRLPAFGKSFTVVNNSGRSIRLDKFEAEILAITEHDLGNTEDMQLALQARNLFYTSSIENRLTPTFTFTQDPEYTSQVDYKCEYPILLVSRPPLGPARRLADGERFDSYSAHLLLFDEHDRSRRMLQICRMYQTLAPWTTENPIYVHIVSSDPDKLKACIDQCASVGFEMLLLSFGSGLNMEDTSPENIKKFKEIADYAHERGIEIGGYSLLASRTIDADNDVIADKIIFANSPCLGSEWGIQYLKNIRTFLTETGFNVLEHDGSYPGDTCRSEKHPGHEGYEDSQYTQLLAITELYSWCRKNGIYLTVPDHYFLAGSTKSFMGYKEVNWSLPREQQVILARQNIHDGLYNKLPSMGWMFVPLTQYHGGGAAATIEPLCEHLDHYRLMLNNNLMAGVQASYRGHRLYDTPETEAMVRESVAVYKQHRAILESPAIPLRRPDGRDFDGYLHVNPELEEKGLLVLFNPLEQPVTRTVRVPLYYTGLTGQADAALFGENPVRYELERDDTMTLTFTIPARDFIWYVIR